jgi:para-aminobenzoate synthetase component I
MLTEVLPWHWQSIPLQDRTGSAIFAALFLGEPIATLLESPTPVTALARYSICAGAPRIVNGQPRCWTPASGEIFSWLTKLIDQSSNPSNAPTDLPFTGGWLGWLGYEASWELEKKLPILSPDPLPFPVAYWYEPANFAVLDHKTPDARETCSSQAHRSTPNNLLNHCPAISISRSPSSRIYSSW